jgi:hypothetical protein
MLQLRKLRKFEKRMPRGIFNPKRYEVTGRWRKMHNEEFYNLNSSPSAITMTKSRRMRYARSATKMGEEERQKEIYY